MQTASRPLSSGGQSKQPPVSCMSNEDQEERDSIADDASFVAGLKEREKAAPVRAVSYTHLTLPTKVNV